MSAASTGMEPTAVGSRTGALFVLPISSRRSKGPLSMWIPPATWAQASRRRWGSAWIVTPQGELTPEEVLAFASRPEEETGTRPGRRLVPPALGALRSDVQRYLQARRFRGAATSGSWAAANVTFVWQRHDLFQQAGLEAARRLRRPLVLFCDAPVVWEARKWGVTRPGWGWLAERMGELPQLRAADLVACISEEVAARVHEMGVAKRRIIVTPNGVDTERYRPDVRGEVVRERYGLDGRLVVGWIGSFRRFHGLEIALEAFAAVQHELPDATLLLVGDGFERERMERRAAELGIRQVAFTGTVPYAEVPEYIGAMDVGLILDPGGSDFHYSPLKLREYMAGGKAIIAPRSGQVGATMADGEDALLVKPNDVGALADAIRRLHRDRQLRERLGASARRKAVREGGWDHQLERIEQMLTGLGHTMPDARAASAA